MHFWGDKWFEEHGKDLWAACDEINRTCYNARIYGGVKEKYGCLTDDIFGFFDGSWYHFLKRKYGMPKFFRWLEYGLVPVGKSEFGWRFVGIAHLNDRIGITSLVRKIQARKLNKTIQLLCKRYPEITDEIVSNLFFYPIIKPCRWGDVDGEEIHNRHWETL